MPRDRKPSDDARLKRRPHITVDLTARSHRIIGPAFADPTSRGILVGLWMLGRDSWATATGNIVMLTHADLAWLTNRRGSYPGLCQLLKVCKPVGYRVWIHGRADPVPSWRQLGADLARSPCQPGADSARAWRGAGVELASVPREFGAVSVHIRNFAKRQNLRAADRGQWPHAPQPQEQVQEQVQEQEEESASPPARGESANGSDEAADPPLTETQEQALHLAQHLRTCILEADPNAKVPPENKLDPWTRDFDRMLRRDPPDRTPETIQQVIDFATRDEFWSQNILSAGKLRKQFDALKRRMHAPARASPAQRREDEAKETARQLADEMRGAG